MSILMKIMYDWVGSNLLQRNLVEGGRISRAYVIKITWKFYKKIQKQCIVTDIT